MILLITNHSLNLTIITFILFTGLVGLITWYLTRKDSHDSSKGYFLGGRTLTAAFIAGSLMLTNLSTEQLVGLNGAAFTHGLSVMAWEIIAAISLVIIAFFFLPRFLRSGIATVPQFLEVRFNKSTRKITSLIFIFSYTIILLPLILYTGATGMINILNLERLLGLEFKTCLIVVIILIGIIGSVYAIFGGLKTVAVSDTLNGIGLLIGGLSISYFALKHIGNEKSLFESLRIVQDKIPEHFNSISKPEGNVPFFTLFSGVFLLNLFYWCTNQQIIQRTFGATNLAEGQKGVLIAGMLKILAPLILVLPGLLCYYMYVTDQIILPISQSGSPIADHAYGTLVQKVMPGWMTGFFAAVLLGAILSSFNSALNSTCTLYSLDIYKGIIRTDASEDMIIQSSKKFGWGIALLSMIFAPLLIGQDSIFGYLQAMNAIYFVPVFAVVLIGLTSKRIPAYAANTGMIFAFTVIVIVYFFPGCNITDVNSDIYLIHNFHFIALVFLFTLVLIISLGKLKPLKEIWVHKYSGEVDMTPWKFAYPMSILLILCVIAIYISYANISVIGSTNLIDKITALSFTGGIIFAIFKLYLTSKKLND